MTSLIQILRSAVRAALAPLRRWAWLVRMPGHPVAALLWTVGNAGAVAAGVMWLLRVGPWAECAGISGALWGNLILGPVLTRVVERREHDNLTAITPPSRDTEMPTETPAPRATIRSGPSPVRQRSRSMYATNYPATAEHAASRGRGVRIS